jgi:hypothetical protein
LVTAMPTFRAYLLDDKGKITWGDWIDAADELEALAKAKELCREDSPHVEVWQGAKKIAQDDCES